MGDMPLLLFLFKVTEVGRGDRASRVVLSDLGWLIEFKVELVLLVVVEVRVDAVLRLLPTTDDRVMNELKVVDDDLNRIAALCISDDGEKEEIARLEGRACFFKKRRVEVRCSRVGTCLRASGPF